MGKKCLPVQNKKMCNIPNMTQFLFFQMLISVQLISPIK